uniref:DNA endonuclease activator Ctp1 C-terminal domain-containing protein n=1 Tax=Globisporangium ultimum (strain ATCC 200006 / CBS 805.95 / DAOM BR144) TaxID=431595 RepID=K3W5G9_GLOUD
MAEDWQHERAALLETVQRQQQDAAKLAKRFKLLQRTLVEQQALLDRYQKALEKSGSVLTAPPSTATAELQQKQVTALNTAKNAGALKAADTHGDSLSGVTSKNGRVCAKEDVCAEEAPMKPASNVAVKRERVSLSSPERQRDIAIQPEKMGSCALSKAAVPPSRHAPMTGSTKDASWISRKADFDHAIAVETKQVVQTNKASDAGAASAATSNHTASDATAPPLSRKRKHGERAPTWAQEKQRMREAGIRLQGPCFRDDKAAALSSSDAAAANAKSATALSSPQSSDKKEDFQYVEVVRNRDARAALPGHDCVECRKYYEALDGVISADDVARQKAACSRHRARFEPYNTPDDFWSLSFPDSVPESQSPLSP